MGVITGVTNRTSYRARNRSRRHVVAELTPDASGDASYTLNQSNLGLAGIESVTLETPVFNGGENMTRWDNANNEFDVYNATADPPAANSFDISSATIVAHVIGPEE